MARLLLVGGGCRGRRLAAGLVRDGHAARIVTRTEAGRPAIEEAGAECWIGTPDEVGTLRYALAGVTLVLWALGTATGPPERVAALHGSRLRMMLSQIIDSTAHAVLYEAAGTVPAAQLGEGLRIVREMADRSQIPHRVLTADPRAVDAWVRAARAELEELLGLREVGYPLLDK